MVLRNPLLMPKRDKLDIAPGANRVRLEKTRTVEGELDVGREWHSVFSYGKRERACATSNAMDGHQVRGTAVPETPAEQAAQEFNEQVGMIVAEVYGHDPQVQAEIRKLRGGAGGEREPRQPARRSGSGLAGGAT